MANDIPIILLVEPCWTLLRPYDDLSSSDKFKIVCAQSGQHALELLASKPVSLIVLDQDMTDMCGIALLKRIVETDPHQHCIFYASSEGPFDDLCLREASVILVSKSKSTVRLWNYLMNIVPIAHSCMQLRRSNRRMSRKLERIVPLERMIGRYAERWDVSYEASRAAITSFARHLQVSLEDLSLLAEQRQIEVSAARQELARFRQELEDRLKESEPGVLVKLEEFCIAKLKTPGNLA